MKHIVTVLLVSSLCSFGMIAVAEKVNPANSANSAYASGGAYGGAASKLILQKQCIFSGLVLETKRGIAITTNRGTFLLKGVAPGPLVGKNVRLTGVIKDESIFAVKINN